MYMHLLDLKHAYGVMSVEQTWCGIYGMAPTIQAQHVVAVTLPTIAVIFLTYLWYKRRSNNITRSQNDPGGGGISRKRIRNRNLSTGASSSIFVSAVGVANDQKYFPEEIKSAMQKAVRDLETAAPIQEICSDSEEKESLMQLPVITLSQSNSISVNHLTQYMTECSAISEENNNKSVESNKYKYKGNEVVDTDRNDRNSSTNYMKSSNETSETILSDNIIRCSENSGKGESCQLLKEISNTKSETNKDHTLNLDEERNALKKDCALNWSSYMGQDCKVNSNPNIQDINLTIDVIKKFENVKLISSDSSQPSNYKRSIIKKQQSSSVTTSNLNNNSANNQKSIDSVLNLKSEMSSSLIPVQPSCKPISPLLPKVKKRKSRKKKSMLTNKNNNICSNDNGTNNCTKPVNLEKTLKSNCDPIIKSTDVRVQTVQQNQNKFNVNNLPKTENTFSSKNKNNRYRTGENIILTRKDHCDNERDSANHSPIDIILNPQLAQFSDVHSENSSDSGKGCSEDAISPSPQTPAGGSSISGDPSIIILYQFVIPQEHVGKLIGKHGQFINSIKAKSNTRIYIKKHPTTFKKKICALEGSQQEIDKALELIRNRFPADSFPEITLEEFPVSLPIICPLRPELFQLDLVEGVNNDVVISSVVSAGHLFLQQPMHPTYQSLTLLNLSMNQVYNSPEAPLVLKAVKDSIVAAPAMDGWYRAQVISVDEESELCEVRFLDYGGYLNLSISSLRAVRADFLTLPFQAVECFLANVNPIDDTWCEDAKLIVQGLTYGQILQAQVYDYSPEGIPLILLYAVHGSQVILINQELIARGFAYPLSNENLQSDKYYVCS